MPPLDTAKPPCRPEPLAANMERALASRVRVLAKEQREALAEFNSLYHRSDQLLFEIVERQNRLRGLREILLNRESNDNQR